MRFIWDLDFMDLEGLEDLLIVYIVGFLYYGIKKNGIMNIFMMYWN